MSATAARTASRTAEIDDRAHDVHGQGRSPHQRLGVAERLLSLQQDQRAVRELLGARPERARTASPIPATTSCAPRQRAHAQQHLAARATTPWSRCATAGTASSTTTRCRSISTRRTLGLPAVVPRRRCRCRSSRRSDVTDYDSADYGRMLGAIDPAEHQLAFVGRQRRGDEAARPPHAEVRDGLPDHRPRLPVVRRRRRATSASTAATRRSIRTPTASTAPTHRATRFASFLLGYPSGDPGNVSSAALSTPLEMLHALLRLLRAGRLPRELEADVQLRPAPRARARAQEKNDYFTVAFDRTLNPGGALGNVRVNGQPVRGGLVYAGQNGCQRLPGQPARDQGLAAARRWSIDEPEDGDPRRLRHLLGAVELPGAEQHQLRPDRRQPGRRCITQGAVRALGDDEQPVPERAAPADAERARRADRRRQRRSSSSIRTRRRRTCTCTRWTSSRELPGNIAVGFEYAGRDRPRPRLGGSNDGIVNINQVPYSDLVARRAALTEQVPNPFFGLPAGQGFNVTSPTVAARAAAAAVPAVRQHPDAPVRRLAENQYHAAIFKFEKRVSNGWGGRINYTYSRLEDNQFGERQLLLAQRRQRAGRLQHRRRVPIGLLDVPHKIVLSPIIELPFGEGKRWAEQRHRQPDPRRLDRLVDHLVRERLPDVAQRSYQRPGSIFGGRCSGSTPARATRRPTASRTERIDRQLAHAPARLRRPGGANALGTLGRATARTPARRTATTGTSWRPRTSASAAASAASSASRC